MKAQWINWPGGDCPVDAGDVVCVQYGDDRTEHLALAGTVDWKCSGPQELRRYRVVAVNGVVASSFRAASDRYQSAAPGLAMTAAQLLEQARHHMSDRAVTYDAPEGERSMAATIAAFNAITGLGLREAEGWLLMVLLKLVRGQSTAAPHRDSVEDLVSYAALFGEARLKETGK